MAINSDHIAFNRYYYQCNHIRIPDRVVVNNTDWSRKFDWMPELDTVEIGEGYNLR